MESDLNVALAVSLIKNKPDGMDVVDYVTSVQSKIMRNESELFFQEFLCDSESDKAFEQQLKDKPKDSFKSFIDLKEFKNLDDYNTISTAKKKFLFDREISSDNSFISNFTQKSNTCLIQPIITMKTLNEYTKAPVDSGYGTYNVKEVSPNIHQNSAGKIQSLQKALDYFSYILFDNSKLLEVVVDWDDSNNQVRYFFNLVANMAESNEFNFTCRDYVMNFIQNTAFRILDSHHLYKSVHVEYQCNLLAKFCFDKYMRWSIINLLINRLKIDIQIVPNYNSHRSIFYTFHFIDMLLHSIDFQIIDVPTKNNNPLTELWKTNLKNEHVNQTENIKQMVKEWKSLLGHISMEALKKNVFLVSIRAGQCLESLPSITLE